MRVDIKIILWLLCLAHLAIGEESAFIQPVLEGSNVEFYDYNDVRYGIFLDKVIFEEAKQACISKDGSLVEYIEESVPLFIARALAESAVGFSTLWIGGVYTPPTPTTPGVWNWLSGEPINQDPLPEGSFYPMTSPPYWVAKPKVDLNETACLVTDRNNHNMPLIDGLTCVVRRPFICAMPITFQQTKPTEVGHSFQSKGKKFHLYRAQFTWQEALGFCRSMGFQLAVVTKPDEFEVLQNRMKRYRPVIESAWIGGIVLDRKWVWVSTNEEIDVNQVKNGASRWFRPDEIIHEGCLLADRHMCDYIVYLEAKCDRRRNVICQQELAPPRNPIERINGTNIFISTLMLTWPNAQKMCEDCLQGGSLFQLAVHDPAALDTQVQWLFTAMSVLFGTEVRHVWLNGRLEEEEFKWGRDPKGVSKSQFNYTIEPSQLTGINREHGIIEYCPGDFKVDPSLTKYECLNMDRENLKHFFMYGLDCEIKQHFICMGNDENASILQDICMKGDQVPFNRGPGASTVQSSTTTTSNVRSTSSARKTTKRKMTQNPLFTIPDYALEPVEPVPNPDKLDLEELNEDQTANSTLKAEEKTN